MSLLSNFLSVSINDTKHLVTCVHILILGVVARPGLVQVTSSLYSKFGTFFFLSSLPLIESKLKLEFLALIN